MYGLLFTTATLLVLAFAGLGGSKNGPVWLMALIAFVMIGSYFGGAMSLDFGGKRGSATASGLIDGIGYLGGVLAGDSMASVLVASGWKGLSRFWRVLHCS